MAPTVAVSLTPAVEASLTWLESDTEVFTISLAFAEATVEIAMEA